MPLIRLQEHILNLLRGDMHTDLQLEALQTLFCLYRACEQPWQLVDVSADDVTQMLVRVVLDEPMRQCAGVACAVATVMVAGMCDKQAR